MASGKQHNAINFALLGTLLFINGVLAVLHLPFVHVALCVVFALAYAFGTLFLSPDLDMAEERSFTVDCKRNWGILGPLWVPYGFIFKHRGVSHSWIMGPLSRLLYLGLMLLGPWALLWWAWPQISEALAYVIGPSFVVPHPLAWLEHFPWWPWWPVLGPALAGYMLSQWAHNVTDVFYSAAKNPKGKEAATPLGAVGRRVVRVSDGRMRLAGNVKTRPRKKA